MNDLDHDLKGILAIAMGFFCFVLLLYIIGAFAKDSCIEQLKDKTATEIKVVCG